MTDDAREPPASPSSVLVLGEPGSLGEALVGRLRERGVRAETSDQSSDAEVKALVQREGWDAVAVITRDDALALRLTLLCAHLRPDLALWATLFDRTIGEELRTAVPHAQILSPSELAGEILADACLRAGARPRGQLRRGGRLVDDALRLSVLAGLGLLTVLIVQTVVSVLTLHEGWLNAIFFSARALATIADSPGAASADAWFKVIATLDEVAAVALLALFTAALVRIANRPRLTTALGRRRAPARGHVIVVGLGQVGFRLLQSLQRRHVAAIALESDAHASAVRLAPRAGLAVALGRGDDRGVLERLGVRRCAVVAAVTSDDLTNVAVGMAVRGRSPGTALVLRLGDGDVASETESLLHLGEICDIHHAIADMIVGEILPAAEDQPVSGSGTSTGGRTPSPR